MKKDQIPITLSCVLALSLLIVGCRSGSKPAQLLQPEIALLQEPLSQFLLEYRGRISVGFQMAVRNPSGEPITLKRLELQTLGTGAYYLRRFPLIFNTVIQPNDTGIVTFMIDAWSQGGRLGSSEPVTVRGIAYFDSPAGQFRRIFMQHLRPTAGAY